MDPVINNFTLVAGGACCLIALLSAFGKRTTKSQLAPTSETSPPVARPHVDILSHKENLKLPANSLSSSLKRIITEKYIIQALAGHWSQTPIQLSTDLLGEPILLTPELRSSVINRNKLSGRMTADISK